MRTWLVSSNEKKFRFQSWISTHNYVYWYHRVKFEIGDIIYMYSTAPTSAIIARFTVEQAGICGFTDLDSIPYQKDILIAGKKTSKFINLETPKSIEPLKINHLKEHGLKGIVQGPRKLKGELLEYIEQFF